MLTKMERKCLEEARSRIEAREDEYICHALEHTADWGRGYKGRVEAVARLKGYIQQQLGWHYVSLGAWQFGQGVRRTATQLRQDRIDWIDWMLEGE